jgi:hypothetical protein
MNRFVEAIEENIIKFIKSKGYENIDDELIDSPLRYYLVKMNNCINKKKDDIIPILEYENANLKKDLLKIEHMISKMNYWL